MSRTGIILILILIVILLIPRRLPDRLVKRGKPMRAFDESVASNQTASSASGEDCAACDSGPGGCGKDDPPSV
jgi:Sec-independent protein translocase protein TatA